MVKPASAGYSPRSLIDKLGMKPGSRSAVFDAPANYTDTLGPLPPGLELKRALRGEFDFLHQFVSRRAELEARLPKLKAALEKDGTLWISWPKKSSGVACDFTEDDVRSLALAVGLVDVKVCAIDAVWSGLKLMYRRKDR